ncbi:MAG: alkaline phosphatase family protein, partial [Pseudodesulfovibrio sp.]
MKLLLVLIDGCRTDSLGIAHTPNIDALMERGCWTMDARTVTPSLTLPVLLSIFTSADPARHGLADNAHTPDPARQNATLVERLREEGRTSAFFYNWEHIKHLTPAGNLDLSLFMDNNLAIGGDEELARAVAPMIVRSRPDFAYLYLGCVDEEGHRSGYGSAPYLAALEGADRALGHVLGALDAAGRLGEYAIIVQADHGGEGYGHHDPVPAVMSVPWIACGKGVRQGGRIGAAVSVLDTAPTAAALLGVEPDPRWEGRAVEI